jgi:hypothetical protein
LTIITQQKGKAKYQKETISLDIDFEKVNLIQVKGEEKHGTKNSMKLQMKKKNTIE